MPRRQRGPGVELAAGLTAWNQIALARWTGHHPAAEGLDRPDRIRADRGGRKRLGLERTGRGAEPVLDQPDAVVQLGRPSLSPQRDFGGALIECPQDAFAHT